MFASNNPFVSSRGPQVAPFPFPSQHMGSTTPFGQQTAWATSPFTAASSSGLAASSLSAFANTMPAFRASSTPECGAPLSVEGFWVFVPFGARSIQAFGTSTPAFGCTSTPGFGQTSWTRSTPVVGQSSSTLYSSLFGTSPLFGGQSSPFGAQSKTFGHYGAFGQKAFPGQQHEGSRVAAYEGTPELDAASYEAGKLGSISAMPIFTDKSHEELRWEDYQLMDKCDPNPVNPAFPFGASSTPDCGAPLSVEGFWVFVPFGARSIQAFGATSTPDFGCTSTLVFGQTSTRSTPVVGQSSSTFNSSLFGGPPSTSVNNAFGLAPAFSCPTVGGTSNPVVGQSSSTFNSSLFGTSSPFGGQSSPFGAQSKTFGHDGAFGQKAFQGQQCEGSRVAAYKETPEPDATSYESRKMGSISAMPIFTDKSHEELRWEDYQLRDKCDPNSVNSALPFGASSTPDCGAPLSVEGFWVFVPFGARSIQAFGATSTPAFGCTSTPGFGQTSWTRSTPVVGQSSSTFNSSLFGGPPSTSVNNAFGLAPAFSCPTVGGTSNPVVGQSSSTFNSSLFGTSSPFGGQSSPFGAQSKTFGHYDTFGQKAFPGQQREGSRVAAYEETPEPDAASYETGKLGSISAMPIFTYKSHEELRWEDFQLGDKGDPNPLNSAFPFRQGDPNPVNTAPPARQPFKLFHFDGARCQPSSAPACGSSNSIFGIPSFGVPKPLGFPSTPAFKPSCWFAGQPQASSFLIGPSTMVGNTTAGMPFCGFGQFAPLSSSPAPSVFTPTSSSPAPSLFAPTSSSPSPLFCPPWSSSPAPSLSGPTPSSPAPTFAFGTSSTPFTSPVEHTTSPNLSKPPSSPSPFGQTVRPFTSSPSEQATSPNLSKPPSSSPSPFVQTVRPFTSSPSEQATSPNLSAPFGRPTSPSLLSSSTTPAFSFNAPAPAPTSTSTHQRKMFPLAENRRWRRVIIRKTGG